MKDTANKKHTDPMFDPERRSFLKMGSLVIPSLVLPDGILQHFSRLERSGSLQQADTGQSLVVVFLRGAADGLNLVIPHGDPRYYSLRPTIGINRGNELDLDGFFGFHPALAELVPYYNNGQLAVIHAVGSPHETRSHFEAQDYMELAVLDKLTTESGWLNRYLEATGVTTPYTGISLNSALDLALQGNAPALAFTSIDSFTLTGTYRQKRRETLENMYSRQSGTLQSAARAAFEAMDVIGSVPPGPDNIYPQSRFGLIMRDVARLIKSGIGSRIISVNHDGWDHHANESNALPQVASDLSRCLDAFARDMGSEMGRTVVMVMTEFGRTAFENGSLGTDHGHGGVMIAMGGTVHGGTVILNNNAWPGLANSDLYQGRDLSVTTDFRDVFAEILHKHLGYGDPQQLFPGFTTSDTNYPGLL